MAYPKLTPITATGGSAARYLGDRFSDMVNVMDYGATGDGTTDDTAAFTAAAQAGKPVFVPDGSYKLSGTVGGSFFGGSGVTLSMPLDFYQIDARMGRLACLAFKGTSIGPLPFDKDNDTTNWGRAIQGFAYDKYSGVLYAHANYAHQGVFLFAFDWKTKKRLGTNYPTAFYDCVAHQGIGLYRPDAESEPLLFSGGNEFTEPDTEDTSKLNELNLIKWDYSNPGSFTKQKTWYLFDTSTYTLRAPNVCVSEDGTKLCAITKRTSDGFLVVGVWNISDIISAENGMNIQSLALHIFESPWGSAEIAGQNMACDSENIYFLNSNARVSPHYIKAISINTGAITLDRYGSKEGFDLGYVSPGAFEGEAIGFLPIGNRTHFCMAVTVSSPENGGYSIPEFFDMETPSGPMDKDVGIVVYGPGQTGTTADTDDDFINEMQYFTSGSFTDLSGGAWFLDRWFTDRSGAGRQIAYRGNTAGDIRTRVFTGVWSDWNSFVFEKQDGLITILGSYIGDERSTNQRSCLLLQANRDDPAKSGFYIERFCQNSAQASFDGNSFIDFDSYINNVRKRIATIGGIYSSGSYSYGFVSPGEDNKVQLGSSDFRYTAVYAVTGSIQTSDERVKQNVSSPIESLLRAWGNVEYKTFQFDDAVEKKGEGARIHVGLIAQSVARAFASEGLDAERYGLFCYDKWEDEFDELEDGTKIKIKDGGDRYGIRYEEALALECAYLRSRMRKMQEQIDILVERVNQLTNNTNN